MALVLVEVKDRLGVVTLNHPEKRNALCGELIRGIFEALDACEAGGAHVVILRAMPGSCVWSAGHDIGELPHRHRDPLPYEDPFESLLRRVQEYPHPILAMIEGGVWGGAMDLALSCDILIGCETATFAITPAKIGVPYNPSGLIHFLSVLGLNKAKEMFYTATPVSAETALQVGILNHLVPASELDAFTRELAGKILQNAPLTIAAIKEQFRLLTCGVPLSSETFERIQSVRRRVYDSEDYREGLLAFHEKRKPVFCGR